MDPQDLGRFFRGFFGFPGRDGRGGDYPGGPLGQGDEDENLPPSFTPKDPWAVLTEPLHMHRFFQQEMDELLKGLGSDIFKGLGAHNHSDWEDTARLKGGEIEGSKRDFMLKHDDDHKDGDMDDKVESLELDKLFGRRRGEVGPEGGMLAPEIPPTQWQTVPRHSQDGHSSSYSWGMSTSSKTVMAGDGSRESRTTTRHGDGRVSEVVVREDPGGYSCTERRELDSQGRETLKETTCQEGQHFREAMRHQGPPGDKAFNMLWDKFFRE